MKIGTKSLLFGIHQVFWHPIMVYKAWVYLYGRPSFKETICIIIHDWGYWGKPNLDCPEGILHPEVGAKIAEKLFGPYYWELCICHSRGYIKEIYNNNIYIRPSKLCWADKLSFCFEPRWFYLLRARLSGEMNEIRANDEFYKRNMNELVPMSLLDELWFDRSLQNIRNIPEIQKLLGWGQYGKIKK